MSNKKAFFDEILDKWLMKLSIIFIYFTGRKIINGSVCHNPHQWVVGILQSMNLIVTGLSFCIRRDRESQIPVLHCVAYGLRLGILKNKFCINTLLKYLFIVSG